MEEVKQRRARDGSGTILGYTSNGDGTHTETIEYHCEMCGGTWQSIGVGTCEDSGYTDFHYTNNGDGTHTITIESSYCSLCSSLISEERTIIEKHNNKTYTSAGVNEHMIYCGEAGSDNGCGDLGTEACTDANGDGICDLCKQEILTD